MTLFRPDWVTIDHNMARVCLTFRGETASEAVLAAWEHLDREIVE